MPPIAHFFALVAACMILLLAGCREHAVDSTGSGDSVPAAKPETPAMPQKPPQTAAVNHASTGVPTRLVTTMVNDLANRLGVPADAVSVRKSVPVVWNDGSMGCPEPGMAYAQVLTDGYWTILEADGRRFGYHASKRGHFRLCETAVPDPDGPPPGGRYAGEAY